MGIGDSISAHNHRELCQEIERLKNDQGFAEWLNRIDAVIGYDRRRQIPLLKWRGLFQSGYPGSAAIQCCFSADELQQALKD